MSSKRHGNRSQHHYDTSDGYNWSNWEWVPERYREERYRINSRREYVYQYRNSQYASGAPRSTEGFDPSNDPADDTIQECDENERNTQYQLSSQTNQEIDNTSAISNSSASILNTSFQYMELNSSPLVTSSLTSQLNNLQLSQPTAIAQSPVRTVYNTGAPEFIPSMREPLVADFRRVYATGMNGFTQMPYNNYDQQPGQPQYQAEMNEEAHMSSSMETVTPRTCGFTRGPYSPGTLGTATESFTQGNAPSPPPIAGSDMPLGRSMAPEPEATVVPTMGTNDRNESGSGSKTPQPPKSIHKKITTLTETTWKEELAPEYKVHDSYYFKPCYVFKVLWAEPKGETSTQNNASGSATVVTEERFQPREGKYKGQKTYETIRRFVIAAGDDGHCQCLPILTYGGQGTLKAGVKAKDHAIIYTGKPTILKGEKLELEPIKMVPDTHRDKLDLASRINYAKIYTVEHNVKVHFIGRLDKSSRRKFMTDFDLVWSRKRFGY